MDGDISFGNFIIQAIFASLSPLLIALIWGYQYFKTSSLYPSLICHFLWNSTLNLILFIPTPEKDIAGIMTIAGATATIMGLLSIFLVKLLAERWKLPQLNPWSIKEPFTIVSNSNN